MAGANILLVVRRRREFLPELTSFLFLLVSTVFVTCSPGAAAISEQGAILQKVVYSEWVTQVRTSWAPGSDPCVNSWEGVQCDTTGNIISLNLQHVGLNGPVPQVLEKLTSLKSLDLGNNKSCNDCGPWNRVTGDLGPIGLLVNLEKLVLTSNELNVESFPKALLLLFKLVELRVDNTLIRGEFPEQLSALYLPNLQYLYLGNNSFNSKPLSGRMWGSLTNLRNLSMWGNNFAGEIPPELGYLVNLKYLNLNQNNFYGGLPPELGQLSQLQILLLYKNKFTGAIPDAWRGMVNITHLELQNNYLSGAFPKWLLQYPNYTLSTIRLTNNQLWGSIPPVLNKTTNPNLQSMALECNYMEGIKPQVGINITASMDYNCWDNETALDSVCIRPLNCLEFHKATSYGNSCPPCPDSQHMVNTTSCICYADVGSKISKNKKGVMAISMSLSVLVILAIGTSCIIFRKLRNQAAILHAIQKELAKQQVQTCLYSYNDIKLATRNFLPLNKLGEGGFGIVYKGILSDGTEIAVKKLLRSQKVTEDFLNEVILIAGIRHRNLVTLRGCCIKDKQQILVYEYVENKNLAEALWGPGNGGVVLDWMTRMKICEGIARGLSYLHEDSQPRIIHRDIKAPNILLDKDWKAKIADFGLARLFPDENSHVSTMHIAGTMGYMAPEYATRGQLTDKADVYSFGVLMLEVISGRKNINYTVSPDEVYLLDWAWNRYNENRLFDLLDDKLSLEHVPIAELHRSIMVAMFCIQPNPLRRPSMSCVLAMLLGDEKMQLAMQEPNINSSDDHARLLAQAQLNLSFTSTFESEVILQKPISNVIVANTSNVLDDSGFQPR